MKSQKGLTLTLICSILKENTTFPQALILKNTTQPFDFPLTSLHLFCFCNATVWKDAKSCMHAERTDDTSWIIIFSSSCHLLQNPPHSSWHPLAPSHFSPRVFRLKRPAGGLTSVSHFKKLKNVREDQEYREMKANAQDGVEQKESLKDLQRTDGVGANQNNW